MGVLAPSCGHVYNCALGSKESHQSFWLMLNICGYSFSVRGVSEGRQLLVLSPPSPVVPGGDALHWIDPRAIIIPSIVGGSSSGQVRSGEEGPRFWRLHTYMPASPARAQAAAHGCTPTGRHRARRRGSDGWFADDTRWGFRYRTHSPGFQQLVSVDFMVLTPLHWADPSACVYVNHSAINMFNYCSAHFLLVSLTRAPFSWIIPETSVNVLTVATLSPSSRGVMAHSCLQLASCVICARPVHSVSARLMLTERQQQVSEFYLFIYVNCIIE